MARADLDGGALTTTNLPLMRAWAVLFFAVGVAVVLSVGPIIVAAAEALGPWTDQRHQAEPANAPHRQAMEASAAILRIRFYDVHALAAAAAGASSDVPLRALLGTARDSLVALRDTVALALDEARGRTDPAAPVCGDDEAAPATTDSRVSADRAAGAAEPDGARPTDAASDGVNDGAKLEHSGRIPGLLGILLAIIWWAVRRNSTKPRFRRTSSDQKNWLEKERWRR